MASSKVGATAPTGKKVMVPVSRQAQVAKPKVNKLSSGKGKPVSGVVTGTTVHKPGHDGFSHHGMC